MGHGYEQHISQRDGRLSRLCYSCNEVIAGSVPGSDMVGSGPNQLIYGLRNEPAIPL